MTVRHFARIADLHGFRFRLWLTQRSMTTAASDTREHCGSTALEETTMRLSEYGRLGHFIRAVV
jgi:hypothetical protein